MRLVAKNHLLAGLLCLGFFGAGVQPAAGASDCPLRGRPVDDGRWLRRDSPPLEIRRIRLRFDDGATSRMTAVRLQPRRFDVRLHWRKKSAWFAPLDLEGLGRELGAAVILNAGYYDAAGRPLGYFRSNGKVFNSRVLYRGRGIALHFGALFTVGQKEGEVRIVPRQKFRDARVREAFQAGPLLVRDGEPVPGLGRYREYRRAVRRTVIGLDARGRLLVLVSEGETRGISWCELQEFLVRPERRGGLGVVDAMNLDGGASSQLWVRTGGSGVHIPGRTVPAFLTIAPGK